MSIRLITDFNIEVQMDLFFYHSLLEPKRGGPEGIIVLHLIDAGIRFSATCAILNKDEVTLTTQIGKIWVSPFAPMKTMVQDQESGMRGQCAMDWASSLGIELKYKAPGQAAWIAEKHNDLKRRALHKTESQLIKESLVTTFDHALCIVTFMQNALINIKGRTPYQALIGRQPNMLPPLIGGDCGQVESVSRIETHCSSRTCSGTTRSISGSSPRTRTLAGGEAPPQSEQWTVKKVL